VIKKSVPFVTIAAAAACGHTYTNPPPPWYGKHEVDAGIEDAATTAPPPPHVASVEELEARGPSDAPLMKKLTALDDPQRTKGGNAIPIDVDRCLRVVFAASSPVHARLVDGTGAKRGDEAEGTTGVVPPRGPACAKKGEQMRFVVEAEPDAIVRAVVFTSQ
jgi:hypothetical protein